MLIVWYGHRQIWALTTRSGWDPKVARVFELATLTPQESAVSVQRISARVPLYMLYMNKVRLVIIVGNGNINRHQ